MQDVKDLLIKALKSKLKSYNPETSYMPFHTRLLGSDRMALFSFIQSLNTNFGTSIFELVAKELAKNNFEVVQKQRDMGNKIYKNCQIAIQQIIDNLESANAKPDKINELKAISNSQSGDLSTIKPTKVDLFLKRDKEIFLIDLKTAKPNKGSFKEFKRTLLTWSALAMLDFKNHGINSLIAIPYNPYEPKPYARWTIAGMLDLKHELKVAKEFGIF
ncbi:TdeIII family type II restriction endonuclease [Helicobacter suis]|uniref:TdeIII family type II restriction endonuclease n=1 Tax=Helicobacter suis TaxID=104628 RepID=UPI001F07280C|nr:TdeIII family type II restriction endonuclease [Helicobacter suis]